MRGEGADPPIPGGGGGQEDENLRIRYASKGRAAYSVWRYSETTKGRPQLFVRLAYVYAAGWAPPLVVACCEAHVGII